MSEGWKPANGLEAAPQATDVKYVNRTGTEKYDSSTPPAKAGSYTARLPFLDVAANVDFTVTPESFSYSFSSGAGQTWTKGSGVEAVFAVKRSVNDEKTFGKFSELKIDGNVVAATEYTRQQGNVILRLRPSYLETLSVGSHTITASFSDGSADAQFTVAAVGAGGKDSKKTNSKDSGSKKGVKTGDENQLVPWSVLMAAAIAGFAGMTVKVKKDRMTDGRSVLCGGIRQKSDSSVFLWYISIVVKQ